MDKKSNRRMESNVISVLVGITLAVVLGFVGAIFFSLYTEKFALDWVIISIICGLLFGGLEFIYKGKIDSATSARDNERLQLERTKQELEITKWKLEDYNKIISDLAAENDGIKMNAVLKLNERIISGEIDDETAKRICKIVTANVKELISKLLVMPKRIASNGRGIPNRLSSSGIEMLNLLSSLYVKYGIRANFKSVDFTGLDFTNISLRGADFTMAVFCDAFFSRSDLRQAILHSTFASNTQFFDCQLENSDFNIVASGNDYLLLDAHLEGADMSNISSKSTCLHGAYIDTKTILPNPFKPYHSLYECENGKTKIYREVLTYK
jgi:hypothetical protein